MGKSKLEYIWLDGYKPTQSLRSKTKIVKRIKLKNKIFPEKRTLENYFSKENNKQQAKYCNTMPIFQKWKSVVIILYWLRWFLFILFCHYIILPIVVQNQKLNLPKDTAYNYSGTLERKNIRNQNLVREFLLNHIIQIRVC